MKFAMFVGYLLLVDKIRTLAPIIILFSTLIGSLIEACNTNPQNIKAILYFTMVLIPFFMMITIMYLDNQPKLKNRILVQASDGTFLILAKPSAISKEFIYNTVAVRFPFVKAAKKWQNVEWKGIDTFLQDYLLYNDAKELMINGQKHPINTMYHK
ncbi:MAG: hypothetical protein ACK5QX_03810 [bacterium]